MNFRRFLILLLLLVLPLQATLAATDSCCLKVVQLGEHAAVAVGAQDPDSSCCTQCDFCHHAHAPFVAEVGDVRQHVESIAPMAAPEPPIHSFIADIPPRPDRLR